MTRILFGPDSSCANAWLAHDMPVLRMLSMLLLVVLGAVASGVARQGKVDIHFTHDTVLTDNFLVAEDQTAIIDPGVTITFAGYKSLVVRGVLIAQGSSRRPIRFTCSTPPGVPAEDACWQGLVVKGRASNASFAHCRFEGAFRNLVWDASPLFDSCTFSGNHYGLYCTAKAVPHVKASVFRGNTYGVFADAATPLLLLNTITGNRVGLHVQLSAKPVAGKNMISGNQTDVHNETALGNDTTSMMTIQTLWEALKAVY